jgi:hypothetical protein
MAPRFNAPPGWPTSPPGWSPPSGWEPDRSWPPAPPAWQWWTIDEPTPPGWFPDPTSGPTLARLRWWNGTEWTNQVHNSGYSAPAKKARPTPLPGAALSTAAIVALVVSIIGLAMVLSGFNWNDTVGGEPLGAPGRGDLFGFGAAVSIVGSFFGIYGFIRIGRAEGRLRGARLANAGVIVGACGIGLCFLLGWSVTAG